MEVKKQYIALKTITIKEITRFLRIWVQTVIPPTITTSLYLVIFGNLIGPRIGQIEGFNYIDYIVPGLIMLAVITNSYGNVVSSFYGAKFQRHIEEMLVTPTPHYIILLGFISGGVARGLVVGTVVSCVALLFSDLHLHNIWVIGSIVLFTSVLFSLCGFINGVFARSFDDISIIPTFILTPLTYFGGIFYSISMLPEFWQNASLMNPILYMINTFRYGFLGVSDISLFMSYSICLGFIAALFLFSLYLLKTGYGIRT